MNSFEFNKIAGAVLGTVFVLFGGSILAEALFHAEAPETPGYEIVAAEAEAGGGEGGAAEAEVVSIATLLQTADAEAGAGQFKKCAACHSDEKGGPNKVGPVLWDVVNRPIASVADFAYSSGMKEFSEGGSVNWDYEHLNGFLENPKGYVDGTSMGFNGIKNPEDRAELIAYLRTLSDNPAPLPEAPAEGEAAAEGEATAEGAVAEPGTTTQPEESTSDAQAQAPAVTDADAAQAAPGGDAAPTQAGDAQAEAPAAEASTTEAQAEAAAAAPAEATATEEPAASADESAMEQPAEAEAAADEQQSDAATPAAAAPEQTAALSGDPEAGEKAFRKCKACHAVGDGAKNKLGPQLNGIVGGPIAAVEGYKFSSALTDYAAEHPTWTVEELTAWLTDPKGTVPGTKMSFAGIKKSEDVADIIAYLATFDENGAQTGN